MPNLLSAQIARLNACGLTLRFLTDGPPELWILFRTTVLLS